MWYPKINKAEFESDFIRRSGITEEVYNQYRITLPCDCGADNCDGWAAVLKEPGGIYYHIQFHFPNIDEYLKYILKVK
jgi:hypothetical protein